MGEVAAWMERGREEPRTRLSTCHPAPSLG
jgi:hypothetical protein